MVPPRKNSRKCSALHICWQVPPENRTQAEVLPRLHEFIRFVNESSDEEFAEGLPERLGVAAFADYLAVHNLLTSKIDAFATLVTAYNAEHSIVDQVAFDAAVSEVRGFVAQRHEYLRSTEMAGQ